MRPREPYAAYSVADHERVQLGIVARQCTPSDDRPGTSMRFTVTAPRLNQTNASVLKSKAVDAIAAGHVYLAIDLAACVDIARAGYSVLASIGFLARRAGGELVIEHANEDLRTLFAAASIDKLFRLEPESLP